MDKPPPVVAKAVFFLEEDESATEQQAMVVNISGDLWLVATWIRDHASGTKVPDRVVPMRALSHLTEASGLIRLGLLLPTALFDFDAPPELLQQFGAAQYPSLLHIQTPSSLQ